MVTMGFINVENPVTYQTTKVKALNAISKHINEPAEWQISDSTSSASAAVCEADSVVEQAARDDLDKWQWRLISAMRCSWLDSIFHQLGLQHASFPLTPLSVSPTRSPPPDLISGASTSQKRQISKLAKRMARKASQTWPISCQVAC